MGYHFNTSASTCTTTTYIDDLAIISDNINYIQPLILKLQKFTEWSHMDLNLAKFVITRCLNKLKLKPNTFKAFITTRNRSPNQHKINSFLLVSIDLGNNVEIDPLCHSNQKNEYLSVDFNRRRSFIY